jgi:hypothetical protein
MKKKISKQISILKDTIYRHQRLLIEFIKQKNNFYQYVFRDIHKNK